MPGTRAARSASPDTGPAPRRGRPGHAQPHRRHADHRGRDPVGTHPRRQHAAPRRGAGGKEDLRCASSGWYPSGDEIAAAVNALRPATSFVFTYRRHRADPRRHSRRRGDGGLRRADRGAEDARAILASHYADPEARIEQAPLRMAPVPEGAPDREPGLQGARASPWQRARDGGVAGDLRAMLAGLPAALTGGRPLLSETLRADPTEGCFAAPLTAGGRGTSRGRHRQLPFQPATAGSAPTWCCAARNRGLAAAAQRSAECSQRSRPSAADPRARARDQALSRCARVGAEAGAGDAVGDRAGPRPSRSARASTSASVTGSAASLRLHLLRRQPERPARHRDQRRRRSPGSRGNRARRRAPAGGRPRASRAGCWRRRRRCRRAAAGSSPPRGRPRARRARRRRPRTAAIASHRHRRGAERLARAGDPRRVEVGHRQPGAGAVQEPREREADVPSPFTATCTPARSRPSRCRTAASQAEEDPARGEGRGIAAVAGVAGDMRGLARHLVHVGDRRADVLGGDVAPAQPVDRAAHGAHHRRGLRPVGRES